MVTAVAAGGRRAADDDAVARAAALALDLERAAARLGAVDELEEGQRRIDRDCAGAARTARAAPRPQTIRSWPPARRPVRGTRAPRRRPRPDSSVAGRSTCRRGSGRRARAAGPRRCRSAARRHHSSEVRAGSPPPRTARHATDAVGSGGRVGVDAGREAVRRTERCERRHRGEDLEVRGRDERADRRSRSNSTRAVVGAHDQRADPARRAGRGGRARRPGARPDRQAARMPDREAASNAVAMRVAHRAHRPVRSHRARCPPAAHESPSR